MKSLRQLLFDLLVSLLSILDFFLNRCLKVREVGVDAVTDHLDALVSCLALFLEVSAEQVFLLPEGIVDSLHAFLSRRCDMLEPFLEHLLSLCDLLLPQIQLSCLCLSLSIQEFHNLLQLAVSLVESRLCLAEDLLEDVFKLVDLGLIFNGFARLRRRDRFLYLIDLRLESVAPVTDVDCRSKACLCARAMVATHAHRVK